MAVVNVQNRSKYPQYMVEVDAVKCLQMNVSPADVLSTLSGYVGGSYSSNLNRFTKWFRKPFPFQSISLNIRVW